MTRFYFFSLLFLFSCLKTQTPETVELPTEVRVQVLHHNLPMKYLPVYFKYNTEEFPTYDDPETWMDTMLLTDVQGRIAMRPIREGNHWLVATGYDSMPLPHMVYGSLPFTINLNGKAVLDTVIYVSE